MGRNYEVTAFFSKNFNFKKGLEQPVLLAPLKLTMFIKKTLRNFKKVERTRNYALKCNLYLYFLI